MFIGAWLSEFQPPISRHPEPVVRTELLQLHVQAFRQIQSAVFGDCAHRDYRSFPSNQHAFFNKSDPAFFIMSLHGGDMGAREAL
jgi:hypothetical protein